MSPKHRLAEVVAALPEALSLEEALDRVYRAFKQKQALGQEIRRSLESPHPDSAEIDLGMSDWAKSLPEEEAAELVDPMAGQAVRWMPGEGWTEADR